MQPVAEVALEIDAPLARVWQIMLDLPNYAAWNPFIVRATCDGPLAVGAMLRLQVRWRERGGARSDEIVTELTSPGVDGGSARFVYRFAGPLHTLVLVRAIRTQQLDDLGNGRTRYSSHEEFCGLLARFVPLARVQDGFVRHAAALKAHAEAGMKHHRP